MKSDESLSKRGKLLWLIALILLLLLPALVAIYAVVRDASRSTYATNPN
jgi:ABC-type Fe3+ transport system permease subunit